MTSSADDHSHDHPGRPAVRAVRAVPQPNAVVGVGLIVVGADGRILLGQAHDGRWELPGGKVDPGEGFEQAAARELAEETDLRVAPQAVEVFTVQLAPDSDAVTRLTAGAVTHAAEGRPAVTEPHKIARWEWFGPGGLPPELYAPSAAVLRAWRPGLPGLPEAPSYDYRTDGTA